MFRSPKIMFSLLGGLLAGITFFIGFLMVEPANRTSTFWYMISGFILSEVMLTLSVMEIGGNHTERSALYRVGNCLISIFYFLFSFIVLGVYLCDGSVKTIRIMQVLGLFIALTAHVLFGLACHAITEQTTRFKAERENKKKFKIELECVKSDLLPFLVTSKNINKQFLQLLDLAKFAPESVAGVEPLDQQIFDGISKLQSAVGVKDEKEIEITVCELISFFQKRQILAKDSR